MPIIRGFVERLEIGRAGLVVASLRHDDGSTNDYQIADLDADPERFNERLSKLGILRDAMTRAEPVEVEYSTGDGGGGARTVDRVARITRDGLLANSGTQRVQVMVIGIAVASDNRTGARAEAADLATVATMTADGVLASYLLDLQNPERGVATAMLEMLRAAQAAGTSVALTVDAKSRRIVGVETGDAGCGDDTGDERDARRLRRVDGARPDDRADGQPGDRRVHDRAAVLGRGQRRRPGAVQAGAAQLPGRAGLARVRAVPRGTARQAAHARARPDPRWRHDPARETALRPRARRLNRPDGGARPTGPRRAPPRRRPAAPRPRARARR